MRKETINFALDGEAGKKLDFRVSTMPSAYGEAVDEVDNRHERHRRGDEPKPKHALPRFT